MVRNCSVRPRTSLRENAHPENLPLRVYKPPCYVPSRRHSRSERVQSEIYVEFDSGCTVRLADPVEKSLAEG
jgi:hypothetical protein